MCSPEQGLPAVVKSHKQASPAVVGSDQHVDISTTSMSFPESCTPVGEGLCGNEHGNNITIQGTRLARLMKPVLHQTDIVREGYPYIQAGYGLSESVSRNTY
jgi:hypothetical protein